MTIGATTQDQMIAMTLMVAMQIEAMIQTDLEAKTTMEMAKAKVLATMVTTTNQTKDLLVAHQDLKAAFMMALGRANQANKCLTMMTKIAEHMGRSSVKCGSCVKKSIEKRVNI